MGHKDLLRLYPIIKKARELTEQHRWGFQFKWDQGSFETAILFNEDHITKHPPNITKQQWEGLEDAHLFCPDLLDYHNKLIIEFEEEASSSSGYFGAKKRGHKGHTEYTNTRDSKRDSYYKNAGFNVLKIWESDKEWEEKLKNFLQKAYLDKYDFHKNMKEKLKI